MRIPFALQYTSTWHDEPIELPFIVLVLGTFLPGIDTRVVEDRKPLVVDRNSVAGEMDRALSGDDKRDNGERPEVAWKLVRELVASLPDGSPVRVELLNLSRDDLHMDVEDAPSLVHSGVYKILNNGCYGSFGGCPYGLVLSLWDLGGEPDDVGLAVYCGQVAQAAHSPWLMACRSVVDEQEVWRSLLAAEPGRYVLPTGPHATAMMWSLAGRILTSVALFRHGGDCDVERTSRELTNGPAKGNTAAVERFATTLMASEIARYAKVMITAHHGDWKTPEMMQYNLQLWLDQWVGSSALDRPLSAASIAVMDPEARFGPFPFRLDLTFHEAPGGAPARTTLNGFFDNP